VCVTDVLQGSYKDSCQEGHHGVTRVLVACYEDVTLVARMLEGCNNGVTRVLQGCNKGVIRVTQRCCKGVHTLETHDADYFSLFNFKFILRDGGCNERQVHYRDDAFT
jgi:hypothetical protein